MKNIHSKYNIGVKIGAGGMAEVYEGELLGDLGFKRRVAIKKMQIGSSDQEDPFNLFLNEANLASKLNHPNIVKVTDFFQDATRQFYIVMEFIEGMDLRSICNNAYFTIHESLLVMQSVLKALHYAHSGDSASSRQKLIHRDISPHNIMLSKEGVVKLLDFGLAKALQNTLSDHTGVVRGKVSYMSPEQAEAKPLDGRSDLFSLGVVFYELLTGKKCFNGQSDAATLSQLLTTTVPPPSSVNPKVPSSIDSIVLSLIDKDREKRLTNAKEALEQVNKELERSSSMQLDFNAIIARGKRPKLFPSGTHQNTLSEALTSTQTLTQSEEGFACTSQKPDETVKASDEVSTKRRTNYLLLALFFVGSALALAFIYLSPNKRPTHTTAAPTLAVTGNASVSSSHVSPAKTQAPKSLKVITDKKIEPEVKKRSAVNAKKGMLSFKAKPWAKIYVDKKYIGQTPQFKVKVKRSPVFVEFVNEEYGKRIKEKVFVTPGKTKTLFKDMTK